MEFVCARLREGVWLKIDTIPQHIQKQNVNIPHDTEVKTVHDACVAQHVAQRAHCAASRHRDGARDFNARIARQTSRH